MSDLNFGTTTIMMVLFFGSNAILFGMFQLIHIAVNAHTQSNRSNDTLNKKDSKDHAVKELSKPFTGTLECFANITTELFRTGLIMALTYICEKHWIFDHSGKQYSRDLFMFILIVFFAYGFYTLKPVHDLTLLSREQTEEWKGWMQFIFLLYHYFHAEEVYNSVRVMITCYVWMTGFGNFQFFYVKQDFGWLRVVQMLWRLNFSVLLLMWTHGNTWILYYICPMHTFYFVMVYLTMYVFSSVNHSKWGIRFKLLIVGIIIYIVWDINQGLFDVVFAWLGTDSVIGATNGSVWEYYFRTSLDHWSSFLGMIFAINFPLAEQFFYKARGTGNASNGPLYIAFILFSIVSIWWLQNIYFLPKLEYNLVHSYYAIIPLTAYIFFRNITPGVRSMVSMSMHDLGKTTLETYLLQHHVWLTSNAKTLLTIVPNHPWINFALATILFFVLSKELYRLTMSLRGMILPEDKNIAFTNIIGLSLIFGLLYVIASILHTFEATILEITIACYVLTLMTIFVIGRFARQTSDNALYQLWSRRVAIILVALIFLGGILQLGNQRPATSLITTSSKVKLTNECLQSISHGHWNIVKCDPLPAPQLDRKAFCETDQWIWDDFPDDCPVSSISTTKVKSLFKGKTVVFAGDSTVRNTYHELNKMLDPTYHQMITNATFKHASLEQKFPGNTTISFVWTPMTQNVTQYLQSIQARKQKIDLLIIGAMVHDALYVSDLNAYISNVKLLQSVLPQNKTVKIWLQPTTIVDGRLPTQEKQLHMNEAVVSTYRKAVASVPGILASAQIPESGSFQNIIDPTLASIGKEPSCSDGIHYGEDVYTVIAQMIANTYAMHVPNFYSTKYVAKKGSPKATGVMSKPEHGAAILLLSLVMLLTLDGFLGMLPLANVKQVKIVVGIGYFSLLLFGRSFDWEAAFEPIHKRIGVPVTRHATVSESVNSSTAAEEKESLIESGTVELSTSPG